MMRSGLRGHARGRGIAIAAKPARSSATRPCIRGELGLPTASGTAPAARASMVAALRGLPTEFQGSRIPVLCSLATSQLAGGWRRGNQGRTVSNLLSGVDAVHPWGRLNRPI